MKIKNQCFCRYLKPGALAQLRNSKISARSHKPRSVTRFLAHPVDSVQTHMVSIVDNGGGDQVPCFLVSKIYGGPQCLGRKKLVAARPVFFLNLETNNVNNDSLIGVFNGDNVVAH